MNAAYRDCCASGKHSLATAECTDEREPSLSAQTLIQSNTGRERLLRYRKVQQTCTDERHHRAGECLDAEDPLADVV